MRILITGVAGFLGCNLARRLVKDGHEVIGIDNFSHGTRDNIKGIEMEFQEYDLLYGLPHIGDNYDVVVHLASQKIPRYDNALRTLYDNARMTEEVVNYCIDTVAKLVFASTSDVYGKNTVLPFTEESDLVLGPTTVKRWTYASSKIHSEQYIMAAAEKYGFDYTIMRFFSSYGPYQNTTWWGGPQGVFIDKINRGEPIEIHGDGEQTRCFTYVDDTVDGIVRCIEGGSGEIFNIGNPDTEISILNLAGMIGYLIGKEPIIKYVPYSDFGKYEDVRRRVPDVTKAYTMLGYKPHVDLTEGLTKTIAWQIK